MGALSLLLRAFAVWLVLLGLAIANGALREALLVPLLGRSVALPASGLLLSLLVVVVATVFAPWLAAPSSGHRFVVGCLWLSLTLLFEFGFGILLQHKSLATLLEAYSFKGGNLWSLVLLVILASPLIGAHLRRCP